MAIKRLTEKDDELTLSSKAYTQIDALGGNDNITIATGSANGVVVNAGAGNDTITLAAGSRHEVNLTSGDNVVTISAGVEHVIKGGSGADAVTIANDAAIRGFNKTGDKPDANGLTTLIPSTPTLALSKGNDTVTINGGRKHLIYTDDGMNTTADKGAGDDLVYVFGGQYNIVQMAGGKDTLKLYSKSNVEKDIKGNTFATGADEDTIVVGMDSATTYGVFANRIQAGAAKDRITLTNGAMSNFIWGDAGNDTINIEGGYANKIFGDNKPTSTLADGAGNDTVLISGGKSNYVHTADGADSITLSGTAEVTLNKVHGGFGKDLITATGGQRNFFYGDEDNDTLKINGGTGNYFYGGAGQDTISLNQANGNVIFGDKGYADSDEDDNDTITVNGDKNKVYGNGGADIITVNGDNNKLYGNSGADTITVKGGTGSKVVAGTGDDVLKITAANNISANLGAGKDKVEVSGGTGHEIYTDENNVDDYGDIVVISGTTSSSKFFTQGGKDTVTVKGSAANTLTILAGAAADTITIEGGTKIKAYGDTGADEITVLGGSDLTVMGDEEDDRIIVLDTNNRVNHSTFHLGSGDDYISAKNTVSCIINASSGHNTVYLFGDNSATDNYILAGGNGSDIDVAGCSNTLIESYGSQKSNITVRSYLGDNSQTTCNMNLSNGINVVQLLRPLKDSTINTGSEYDIFYLNYSPTTYTPLATFNLTNVTINAGAGNNVLKANNLYGGTVSFGDGSNTVNLNGCNDTALSFGKGSNEITLTNCYDVAVAGSVSSPTVLSAKSETINATDSSWLTLKTGDGDDYINLKDNEHTGNCYNLIDAGQGEDHIIKYYGDKNYIYGLEGADTITVYSGYMINVSGTYKNMRSEYDKISGGAGNDDIRVNYADKVYICGGSGDDKLVLSESKTFCIKGGLGNDTITLHNTEKGIVYGGAGNDEFILSKESLKMQNGVVTPQPLENYNPSYVTLVGGAGSDKYNYWSGGKVYIDNKTGHASSDKDTVCIGVTNSSGGITGDLWNEFTNKYNVYYFQDVDAVVIRKQADTTDLCISGFSLLDSISIYCGGSKTSSEWLSWAKGIAKTTNNGTTFYQDMNQRGVSFSSYLTNYVTSENASSFNASDSTLTAFKAYDSDLKISGNF